MHRILKYRRSENRSVSYFKALKHVKEGRGHGHGVISP